MTDTAGRLAFPTGGTNSAAITTSPFDALGSNLRFGQLSDETPFVVAEDFGRAMDYSSGRAATRLLDDDEKGVQILHTLAGRSR